MTRLFINWFKKKKSGIWIQLQKTNMCLDFCCTTFKRIFLICSKCCLIKERQRNCRENIWNWLALWEESHETSAKSCKSCKSFYLIQKGVWRNAEIVGKERKMNAKTACLYMNADKNTHQPLYEFHLIGSYYAIKWTVAALQ